MPPRLPVSIVKTNNNNGEKKDVRFDSSSPTIVLPQAHDPVQEDTGDGDCWYTNKALSLIRDETKITVRSHREAGWDESALDPRVHCTRGLEDFQHGVKEKKLRTRNIIHSIVEEQGNQRKMGISDPKGLQVLSSACSKRAKERARSAAKADEKECIEIYREEGLLNLCTSLISGKRRVDRRSWKLDLIQRPSLKLENLIKMDKLDDDQKLGVATLNNSIGSSAGSFSSTRVLSEKDKITSSARSA